MKPLKKGDVIKCKNCGPIWEAISDCGDIISANDFKGINGHPDPKTSDKIDCPKCGRQLILANSIYPGLGHKLRD